MKQLGFLAIIITVIGTVFGSIQALEAVMVFLLAGVIPGIDLVVAPLAVLGGASIIAGAFWLPAIVEGLLFPVRLTSKPLPKKRYAKL